MQNIIISSDFLMTKESEQMSNLRWLTDLLRRPLVQATGLTPHAYAGSDSGEENPFRLDRKKFFELSGLPFDPYPTHSSYEASHVSEASIAYLQDQIGLKTLVLGYEMSAATRTVLDRAGIPFIDIWLHPVRFTDDIMFGMRSNVSAVHSSLKSHQIPQSQMQLYADRLRIQTYKGWERKELQLIPNSALFVGQTLNDKSVLRAGRFLTVLDFKDEFTELSKTHEHVYYSRHPYVKTGDEAELEFVLGHSNVSLTTASSYKMIAHPAINTVASLSSSMVAEAHLLGANTSYFLGEIFSFDEADPAAYSSIQHKIVDPSFWNEVLFSLFIDGSYYPARAEPVTFLDPKDKLRDMLGFYWSYADIDKSEQVRKTVQAPKRAPAKQNVAKVAISKLSDTAIAEAKRKIEKAEVVAFDIFDTLVERDISAPGDLFPILEPAAREIVGKHDFNYVEARRNSRHLAISKANGEEVLLKDRYDAMEVHYGLPSGAGKQLYDMEIQAELGICQTREIGKELYEFASTLGKRVILISDTFFEPSVISRILEKCGYSKHDKAYLSSDVGLLKATGNLYPKVLEGEGIKAETMVMIGDNGNADIKQSTKYGIENAHIPDKRALVDASSNLATSFAPISSVATKSVLSGLSTKAFAKNAIGANPGLTKGSPDLLGYSVVGPMFWGFARWITQTAIEDGKEDIYFLARDGKIAKTCYDIINRDNPDAPRSHYLLASRRSTRVANLKSVEDILTSLETGFSPTAIGKILASRFGISTQDIPLSVFDVLGKGGPGQIVNQKEQGEEITKFFSSQPVVDAILARAKTERGELTEYFASQGLGKDRDGSKIGFVDIGHSGSIQRSICDLTEISGTTGMYFVTMEEAPETVGADNEAKAYFIENMKKEDTSNIYRTNILMFETIFLNDEKSFVCLENGEPTFLGTEGDSIREDLCRAIHKGISNFCADVTGVEKVLGPLPDIKPEESALPFVDFSQNPTATDAEIFSGVGFENAYSGRKDQWIIPPTPAAGKAIWKAGEMAILGTKKTAVRSSKKAKSSLIEFHAETGPQRLISVAIEAFSSEPKRRKFRKRPGRFFQDSRKASVRMVGAAFFDKYYD